MDLNVLQCIMKKYGAIPSDWQHFFDDIKQAQTNAQQTHGEICPHYAEGQLENCDKVSMCLCDGKLSPC